MGFSSLFLILLRKNALLSQPPLQSQWLCRSKNILPAFLSNRIPIFGSCRGVSYHRTLLSIEASINCRFEFVAEQIEQFQTEDIEQQKVDTHKTEQQRAVEEVIDGVNSEKNKTEFQHPWAEWTAFMGYLVSNDYFKGFVDDDERDFCNASDILKDYNHVRNACLDFGRVRFDILRSLSKEDIRAIVEHGCPSLDRKVVNSGKLLRSYVNIEEGEVCSKCNLRDSCDRAYLNISNVEGAHTVNLMRILLTYGMGPVTSSTKAKLQMKKTVVASICKLLKDVVDLAATPIDPNLPQPVSKQPGRKIMQASPPQKEWMRFADIQMKAGDWRCPGCNLVNFARNTICIQCNEKRPKNAILSDDWECPDCSFFNFKRNKKCHKCDCDCPKDNAGKLNPGDWECPKCNFNNFRRNMTCLECDHKHPKIDEREIAKQFNPTDWKCPNCSFLNFKRNMTCLKCDCKRPGDYNTELARKLNSGDWKCPECNFMNFGRNMRCLKCDFRHLKDEDKEYDFHAKTNDDMLNSPRRRKTAGLGGDEYNFDDFPVRGGKSEIARGRTLREHGNKNISQFGSGINRSSSVEVTSNDFSDLHLFDDDEDEDEDEDDSNNVNDVDYKRRRVDSGRPSSTSFRKCGPTGNNYNSDGFPVLGGSGTVGLRKLEKNGNKAFSRQSSKGDKSSLLGDYPNDLSDLDEDDGDVGYKWKGADGGRSSDRSGRLSTSFKGKGKGYNYDDTDDDDSLFDSGQGKRLGPSERPLSSKTKSVKRSFENFGDFDEDDDDLCESKDEQPQVSRTKQKGNKRSLSSKSKSVKKSFENFGDFDEGDDNDLYESEDEQPQVSRTKRKGDKRSFGG